MMYDNFDWAHPDFSVQLLNGELPTSKPAQRGSGVFKRGTTASSSRSASKSRKRIAKSANPGGNYNYKKPYGKGVYRRDVQINPDVYVDDLEEFLDNQGNIQRVVGNAAAAIRNSEEDRRYLNARLSAMTGRGQDDRSGMSLSDANKSAQIMGSPTFVYNNRTYKTVFNDGDHLFSVRGDNLGPVPDQQTPSGNPKRANYDGMSFKNAFAAARRAGLDKFNWRGKDYAVRLAGQPNTRRQRRTQSQPASPQQPTLPSEPMDRIAEGIEPYKDIFGQTMNNPYATHAYPDQNGYACGGWMFPILL